MCTEWVKLFCAFSAQQGSPERLGPVQLVKKSALAGRLVRHDRLGDPLQRVELLGIGAADRGEDAGRRRGVADQELDRVAAVDEREVLKQILIIRHQAALDLRERAVGPVDPVRDFLERQTAMLAPLPKESLASC